MPSPLPNELWQRILGFATLEALSNDSKHDWIHLWAVSRQVSRSWRAAIAKEYLEPVLQYPGRCMVSFDLGNHELPDPNEPDLSNNCSLGVELVYDRMDGNDKNRVVFKKRKLDPMEDFAKTEQRNAGFDEAWEREQERRWGPMIDEYIGADEKAKGEGGKFDRPPHVISIYGASLDSELPGLQYDYDEMEISFEWEGMLDAFCREYTELDKRNKALIPEGIEAKAEETYASQTAMFSDSMMEPVRILIKIEKSNLRAVRRERIMKFYNKKELGFEMVLDSLDEEYEEEQLGRIQCCETMRVGRDNGRR